MPAVLCLSFATVMPTYAASDGCNALIQAGLDASSGQIRTEDDTIRQPTSVKSLTCLGDFFGGGLKLLTSLTDVSSLINSMAGQFCTALRNAWESQLGSANCGISVTGINFGFGGLGGGSFCGTLTIGGGGGQLGSIGVQTGGGGGSSYVPTYNQRPTGY